MVDHVHHHFCTLFDRNYLFKGLALYESLAQSVGQFTLWVLCMDDEVRDVLRRMDLDSLELVSLSDFEDEDLLLAKATRTAVEYCWTCTPSLPLYLLDHVQGIPMITYLDADVWFFSDPSHVYAEMDGKSIGIVAHRYAARFAHQAQDYGIYNVQFMAFRNDTHARDCLAWWRARCNEWCYYRVEDGKMGDQKYLDDWPTRFQNVAVLEGKGAGLAPWNLERYQISRSGGHLAVDGEPLTFFHFHSLRITNGGTRFVPAHSVYGVSKRNVRLVYVPYYASLRRAVRRVRRTVPGYEHGIASQQLDSAPRALLRRIQRRIRRWVRGVPATTSAPAASPSACSNAQSDGHADQGPCEPPRV